MTHLLSFKDVFDELGGIAGLSALTGSKPNAVDMWQRHKRFPWKTYPVITGALLARGKMAPGDIWGLKGKEKAA